MSTLQNVYRSLRGEPLFLPKGSIRAIIALSVVGSWVGLLFLSRDVPKEFYVILGAVITFYFQARENDKERELEKARLGELTKAAPSVSAVEEPAGGTQG